MTTEAVGDSGVDEAVDIAMWPASDITAVGGVGDVTSATGTGYMMTPFGDAMGPQGDVTATAAANVDKPTTASGAGDEAEVSGDGTVTTSSGAAETTDTGDVTGVFFRVRLPPLRLRFRGKLTPVQRCLRREITEGSRVAGWTKRSSSRV